MSYTNDEEAVILHSEIVRVLCLIEFANAEVIGKVRQRLRSSGLGHQAYMQVVDLMEYINEIGLTDEDESGTTRQS